MPYIDYMANGKGKRKVVDEEEERPVTGTVDGGRNKTVDRNTRRRGKPEVCQGLALIPRGTIYRVLRTVYVYTRSCKSCIIPTQGLERKTERNTEV